jgi:hypothetical protein
MKIVWKSKRRFIAALMCAALMVFLCVPKVSTHAESGVCGCSNPMLRWEYESSFPAGINHYSGSYTIGSVTIYFDCTEYSTTYIFRDLCVNCGTITDYHAETLTNHSDPNCFFNY